jgi:hypothetical protein
MWYTIHMAHLYLYETVEVFPLEKLDEETEENTEPSEPIDYLAEWRFVVHI